MDLTVMFEADEFVSSNKFSSQCMLQGEKIDVVDEE